MKRTLTLFCLAVLLSACASAPVYYGTPEKGSRVGIVMLVDKNPQHRHAGPTVFQNNAEAGTSKTNFHPKFFNAMSQVLAAAGHSAHEVVPAPILVQRRTKLFAPSMGWPILDPEVQSALRASAAADSLDYIVIVFPVKRQAWPSSSIYHEGYGLETRCLLATRCGVFAFDYVAAQLYDAKNDAPLSKMRGRYWSQEQKQIKDLVLGHDDIDTIPVSRIDEAGEIAVKAFLDRFEQMLVTTEFASGT